MWYMNYSQIMSPRPPLPRKVGVMTPSSYGSAAPEWQTNSIWIIKRCHFQRPWTTSSPDFKVTPLMVAECLWNGTRYVHSFQLNTNRDLHTPWASVSFRMTVSDPELLSEIFNDTKRRAVSLRQLSLLYCRDTLRMYSATVIVPL